MARVVLVWLLGLWMSTAIGRRVDDRKQIESNRMVDELMYARNVDAKAGGEPEIEMTTPEIIANRGYPVEIHLVTTDDGYILELHRIPFGRKAAKGPPTKSNNQRPVVFLQHGLLGSSADWILNSIDRSLAFLLADRGYDVWLGNARGNTYSRKHRTYDQNDPAYWKFTWDEMGRYDIPAELNYVLAKTSRDGLVYIGHSMGTTMFWVAMETRPELNDKIELMVGLAPVASVARMKSPIKFLAPFANRLETLFHFLGTDAFLPSSHLERLFQKYVCDEGRRGLAFCENILFLLSGSDPANFNAAELPLITAHTPAGTSTYTPIHYLQEYLAVGAQRFQRMDWGPDGNMAAYGTPTPPAYNLTAVAAPVVLFFGDNDWLATPQDVTWLAKQLVNLKGFYRVDFEQFNHLDFLWALNVNRLLYDRLLDLLP